MYAGQGVGLADRVRPAGSIVGKITREAAEVLNNLGAATRLRDEW